MAGTLTVAQNLGPKILSNRCEDKPENSHMGREQTLFIVERKSIYL